MESRLARFLIKAGTGVTLFFLYAPLVILALYAFNKGVTRSWPPGPVDDEVVHRGVERRPRSRARSGTRSWRRSAPPRSRWSWARWRRSPSTASRSSAATRSRSRSCSRIALPGIVTAIALSSSIDYANSAIGLTPGLLTIIIGHATFCIVVVFNNVIARLRRTPTSLVEASMDLGADGWQTFKYVTFPALRTALVAGGLLAFGLSFDEIVVTNFTAGSTLTLPIWIFNNLRLPKQQPVVNAVALVLMLLSIIPVYFAQRLAGGGQALGAVSRRDSAAPSRRWRAQAPARGTGRREAGRRAGWAPPAAGEAATAELLELRARGRLLREHRGLDPVEQALEPADELRLGDPDLRLARHLSHRRSEGRELVAQVLRDRLAELFDRPLVHLGESRAARLVQRRVPGLLQQLAHHARDPQQLRRLGDRLRGRRPCSPASTGTACFTSTGVSGSLIASR